MAITFIVSSCSLDIEGTDSIITEEEAGVFDGVNPETALEGVYNNIRAQTEAQDNLYGLTEVTTDEQLVPTRGTDWGDNGIWRTLHTHTWTATHAFLTVVWNDKNGGVLRASEIIDPKSNASAEQLAHAKFCRAYNMWIIMDFYGQVPFRDPNDGPEVIPSVMSREEAYDLIVSDLEDAIEGLPATAATKDRAVKSTARFLLAKVKLNANVYLGAYGANDLADVISLVDDIEADGYAIQDGNYFRVFVDENSDVIWKVGAGTGNRKWNSLHYSQNHPDNGGGGWNGFTTLSEFYDKFEGDPNQNTIGGTQEERRGYTHTMATTDGSNRGFGYGFQIGQMFGWDGTSAIELKDRSGNNLAFTRELESLTGNNDVTGIRLLKYSVADGAYNSGVVTARFSDAHLMRAEAMLRLDGDDSRALAEVNELRALRANTPALPSLDMDELLDERAREVYLEGWRRNDQIRFGVFKSAWQFKDEGDGHTDLFPIPASALVTNPNLVQNPGY